jgi:hypothetical protein
MLMVIFGAGASFDSCPTYTGDSGPPGATTTDIFNRFYRPPLAKDLFANRPLFIQSLDAFPQCNAIIPRLRAPEVVGGQRSIETVLQEIEGETNTYPRARQELAAVRCYLQRAISQCETQWRATTRGVTNYLTLLRNIESKRNTNEPVCLVTFNYDTLLEAALDDLGLGIKKMEDYTHRPVLFRVFKPHGSVNWARRVERNLPPNVNVKNPHAVLKYLIETAALPSSSTEIELCNQATMELLDGGPGFPAIAIPVEKKGSFECPPDMINQLKSALPSVSKILVIGWRATEDHFLDLLRRNLKPGVLIYVVGADGPDAEKIRVHIQEALTDNSPSSLAEQINGFTEFVRGRLIENILTT